MLFYNLKESIFIMRNSWYGDEAPKNKWTPHKLPNSWSKPPLPVSKQWGRGNAIYNIMFLSIHKGCNRANRFWNIFKTRFKQVDNPFGGYTQRQGTLNADLTYWNGQKY